MEPAHMFACEVPEPVLSQDGQDVAGEEPGGFRVTASLAPCGSCFGPAQEVCEISSRSVCKGRSATLLFPAGRPRIDPGQCLDLPLLRELAGRIEGERRPVVEVLADALPLCRGVGEAERNPAPAHQDRKPGLCCIGLVGSEGGACLCLGEESGERGFRELLRPTLGAVAVAVSYATMRCVSLWCFDRALSTHG